MHNLPPKAELLLRLRNELAACERRGSARARPAISTGVRALDRVLPSGGILRGSLVEWLDDRSGSGAETLAVRLTRAVCGSAGAIVMVDRERQFYPPALVAWGLALEQLIVVHPANDADALWAADQALRSPAVAAVWLRRERLRPNDFRRLQLAAEEGETLGMLFRPIQVRGQPTWADLQLVVEPRPSRHGRRLHVEVTRCRGGFAGHRADIELDDVTGAVREGEQHETFRVPAPAALADPAAPGRAAGTAGAPAPFAPA